MSGFQSRNRRLKHLQNVAPHQSNLMRLKQRQEFLDRACSEQRFLRIPVHSGIVTGRVPSSNAKSRTGPPDSIISARLLRVGREKLQRQPPRVYLPQSFLPVTTQHFSSARFSVKKSSKSCRHRETSGRYDTEFCRQNVSVGFCECRPVHEHKWICFGVIPEIRSDPWERTATVTLGGRQQNQLSHESMPGTSTTPTLD